MKKNQQLQQIQSMRESILEQELVARSWKAHYEKMYFFVESKKIEEEYKKLYNEEQIRINQERENLQKILEEQSKKTN